MSQYLTIATCLVSPDHLKRALQDMGFPEIEVHDTPQHLHGFQGDERNQCAEVIVRKKHIGYLSNDIGFCRGSNGRFTAIISDYDRSTYDDDWLKALTQRYAYHVARDTLTQQGFDLIEEATDEKGTIQITLRRMA